MKSEFSRIENLPKLVARKNPLVLKASKGECQALAKRAGISAIRDFETTLLVSETGPGTYEVTGQVKATLTLTCGRSLKDFNSDIDEAFSESFISEDQYQKMAEDSLEERDDYEVIEGAEVDLGEMAAQLLILSIDPFPILEGDIPEKIVTSGVKILSEEQARAESSPFAKLKKLKKNP